MREPDNYANVSCAHPMCRTSYVEVECPHGLPFCQHCTWEEACEDCLLEPLRQRAEAAWNTPPTKSPSDFHDADWLHERRTEDRDYEYAQLIAREEERRAG